jgi:hypothetical protein
MYVFEDRPRRHRVVARFVHRNLIEWLGVHRKVRNALRHFRHFYAFHVPSTGAHEAWKISVPAAHVEQLFRPLAPFDFAQKARFGRKATEQIPFKTLCALAPVVGSRVIFLHLDKRWPWIYETQPTAMAFHDREIFVWEKLFVRTLVDGRVLV